MLPKFSYLKALTLEDALKALADHGPEARILAGGTDLLVSMRGGVAAPRHLVDIKHIPEMSEIRIDKDGSIAVGACVTINDLMAVDFPSGCDALCQAASALATNQVRNRATVGGNLCNASPACDLAPPLMVLAARLRLVSAGGERTIDLEDWFVCPKQSCIAEGEILVEVTIPAHPAVSSGFGKRQRIRGHDLAVVNAAVAFGADSVKIAVGAVAPTPLLLEGSAENLRGGESGWDGALALLRETVAPIDDVRASGAYRKLMVEGLVLHLLQRLGNVKRTGGGRGGGKGGAR